MYTLPHQSINLSEVPSIGNNNFYQTSMQRQHQHDLRQRQLFEFHQRQQRNLMNQQQQRAQLLARQNLSQHRSGHLSNTFSPLTPSMSGGVPAGLLPPSFLNSRVVLNNSSVNSNNLILTKENLTSISTNSVSDKAQSSSNTNTINGDESFCKNCKSEFPNVLRSVF